MCVLLRANIFRLFRYATVTSVAERSCRVCFFFHNLRTHPIRFVLRRSESVSVALTRLCIGQGEFFIGMIEDSAGNNDFSVD